jgi:hypothetical protein
VPQYIPIVFPYQHCYTHKFTLHTHIYIYMYELYDNYYALDIIITRYYCRCACKSVARTWNNSGQLHTSSYEACTHAWAAAWSTVASCARGATTLGLVAFLCFFASWCLGEHGFLQHLSGVLLLR